MTFARVGMIRLDGRYFAISVPQEVLIRAGAVDRMSVPGEPVTMRGVTMQFEEIEPILARPPSGEIS